MHETPTSFDIDMKLDDMHLSQAVSLPIKNEYDFGLMSFAAMQREHGFQWPVTSRKISLPVGLFQDLLGFVLKHVHFDESYYLHANADVVDALAKGRFIDAHHHFMEFGYFEGRLPFQVEVDEVFYCSRYPDVEAAVAAGTVSSAQVHFELSGHKEGRLPREDWSLLIPGKRGQCSGLGFRPRRSGRPSCDAGSGRRRPYLFSNMRPSS